MNERLMGVFAPITTPFCEDGAVDYMIEFSAAYSALCHGFMGDWNWAYKEEAVSVMKGGSARVKR